MIFEATDTIVEAANNFGDTREGAGAGPLALAVVALLAIATILLWRNMTVRIKRLPASCSTEATEARPAGGKPADAPSVDSNPADSKPANPEEPGATER